MQALFDRSDKTFDALLARSDELARQLAEVVAQAVPNDTRVRVMEAARIPHGSRSFSSGAGRDRGGGSAGRSQRAPSQVTAGSLPVHVECDAAMRARRTGDCSCQPAQGCGAGTRLPHQSRRPCGLRFEWSLFGPEVSVRSTYRDLRRTQPLSPSCIALGAPTVTIREHEIATLLRPQP